MTKWRERFNHRNEIIRTPTMSESPLRLSQFGTQEAIQMPVLTPTILLLNRVLITKRFKIPLRMLRSAKTRGRLPSATMPATWMDTRPARNVPLDLLTLVMSISSRKMLKILLTPLGTRSFVPVAVTHQLSGPGSSSAFAFSFSFSTSSSLV